MRLQWLSVKAFRDPLEIVANGLWIASFFGSPLVQDAMHQVGDDNSVHCLESHALEKRRALFVPSLSKRGMDRLALKAAETVKSFLTACEEYIPLEEKAQILSIID